MKSDVLKMGHPMLQERCSEVLEFNTTELDELIERMRETQAYYLGAGLAAPQVGCNKRVICFGGSSSRYPNTPEIEMKVLVNPSYEPLSEEKVDGWEGCLSVPGLRGLVSRYQHIRYSGFDQCGKPIEGEAFDFEARVIQHEYDHLEGVLFVQRLQDIRQFGFEEELAEVI